MATVTKELATHYGINIPILTPQTLKAEARAMVQELKPDLLVCFAYGKIFGPLFMELFPLGGINLHPSLLPKYRGCAPIPAAILNMESCTGVSVQKIAQQMDSGNILSQIEISLDGTENADLLLEKAATIGAKQLVEIVNQIADSGCVPEGIVQDHSLATYSSQLCKEDGLLNWQLSAKELDAKIRAFSSWPGTYTYAKGTMLKIHQATLCQSSSENSEQNKPGLVIGTDKKIGILVQTGSGIIALQKLQWQAKKTVTWNDFLNGSRDFLGTCLGDNK